MNDALDQIIQAALENERKTHGKRFSTHQEANACIKEQLDDAMELLTQHARASDFLWFSMRHEDFGEDYDRAKADMKNTVLEAVYSLLTEYVLLEKYDAGVIHEPRTGAAE